MCICLYIHPYMHTYIHTRHQNSFKNMFAVQVVVVMVLSKSPKACVYVGISMYLLTCLYVKRCIG